MDEEAIDRLFRGVLEHTKDDSPGVREIFSILIKTTLRYRDHLLSSRGIIVTVADVRTALKWLLPAMTTGVLPQTDEKIPYDLLTLWLDDLKLLGKADIYLT
jgi:hypothetical protein